MAFADSFSQDMDFWRQRVRKEAGRHETPSTFTSTNLQDLPRNPTFHDSGGMLLGKGGSPRAGDTPRASPPCERPPARAGRDPALLSVTQKLVWLRLPKNLGLLTKVLCFFVKI